MVLIAAFVALGAAAERRRGHPRLIGAVRIALR